MTRLWRTGRLGVKPGVALLSALLATTLAAGSARGQRPPPDGRYLTFDTEHFRVVFPDGLEPFARRAAGSAEWAYRALVASFIEPPAGRIGLVITDHSDLPNASATPLPSNRVTLIATAQLLTRQLNYYSDWVDLALVHELTHIFHLDRAAGPWTVPRTIFGRAPPFFPAFYQPTWVIEGLPTYYESRLTGTGRVYGGYFRTLLAGAGVTGDLFTVDAANGLVPEWPSGSAPYAYGGLYVAALADEHGDSAIAAFARRGAARLPFTLEWAATPHFGRSLSAGWEDWRAATAAAARARADSIQHELTRGEPLTGFGWNVPSARFSPDGRRLAFAFSDPRDDPQTIVLDAETGAQVASHRRNTAGTTAWSGDGRLLYLDQAELADRYRLYRDLYVVDPQRGHERRLTRGARVTQPDVSADNRIVAVQVGEGTTRLVRISESGDIEALTAFDDDVNWGRPRWSPAGDLIAAERWERGGPLEIVLLDPGTGTVTMVTRNAVADMAPAWSPDGRYLLWSSDREGVFEIYAVALEAGGSPGAALEVVDGPWRVTRTPGGATDPEVSPDGSRLVFAAGGADGFRLERIHFDPASWVRAEPAPAGMPPVPVSRSSSAESPGGAARPYSPFPSLWPTGWLPFVVPGPQPEGWLLAAQVVGTDDVRRHSYSLVAGWRTGVEEVEAVASYTYSGWGDPVLQLRGSQIWDGAFALTEDGTVVGLIERERELRLSAGFQRPRARTFLSVTPSVAIERLRFFAPTGFTLSDPTFTDLEGFLGLTFATARAHPRSVSPENGFVALASVEHERLADDWDAWRVTGQLELRAYGSFGLFGFADHAVAGRVALGASDGRDRLPELFDVGGVPGRALDLGAGIAVGGGERYHLRGYPEATQVGDRAAVASLEYRFPLILVGRGYKLWPVLLNHLSAALFVDAGSAWLDDEDDAVRTLASSGLELSSDWGLGYALTYRFRAGVARRLVAARDGATGWEAYLAVGLAF